jgi:uncharacterized protein (TIGR02302 family)
LAETLSRTGSAETPLARRLTARARAALLWERLWAGLWLPATLIAVFCGLSLFEVWQTLPPALHILAVFSSLVAIAGSVWAGLSGLTWPSGEEALRRVEDENGFAHRPLTGATDKLGTGSGDTLAEALWRRHQAKQAEAFAAAKAPVPRSAALKRDPYALRGAAVLFLAAGLMTAGRDTPARLLAAFDAGAGASPALPQGVAFDAWITPPAYTGEAPVILARTGGVTLDARRALMVPAGSVVTLRVSGTSSASLMRSPLAEGTPGPEGLIAAGDRAFAAEFPLKVSERVRITGAGRELGAYDLTAVPDEAPAIAFDGEMEATPRFATRLPFAASDDYGIASARAEIRLAPHEIESLDPTAKPEDDVIGFDLPAGGGKTEVKAAAFQDLTKHPWAGLEVNVTLSATDKSGQTGQSETRVFRLPERIFTKPLAKAVIEQRRNLSKGPAAIPDVLVALEALALAPERFIEEPAHFMGLRAAYWRLLKAQNRAAVREVQDLLWDLALDIEEGNAALAAEEVRRLQQELQQALENGASDAEIQRLMAELRQAMNDYMQALAAEAGENLIPLMDGESMEAADLERMLNEIEEMARMGSREAAQQMLSEMQEMMEALQGPMGEPSARERELAEAMRELDEIAREQQRLLDETFREERAREDREIGEDSPSQASPEELARRQEELRRRLEDMSRRMAGGEAPEDGAQPQPEQGAPQQDGQPRPGQGQQSEGQQGEGQQGEGPPQNLGEAGQAMGEAGEALGRGETGSALPEQERALELLRQAQRDLRQQLAEEQRRQGGMRIGVGRGQRQQGRDPAGRESPDGRADSGDVKVPTERDLQRAREILEELRKRSGERERTQEELDYIERLLRRF